MSLLTLPFTTLRDRQSSARFWSDVRKIESREEYFQSLDDHQLRKEGLGLAFQARSGTSLDDLVVDGFALVREAARRFLGMRHYNVQLYGGVVLHHGSIAEMQTGEGKTLTATLPLFVAALPGKGAHLATANDYLAQRDADLMRPVYENLGLSVGVVTAGSARVDRRKAYSCDITYGTSKEFGFDFLRDRLQHRFNEQFGHPEGIGFGMLHPQYELPGNTLQTAIQRPFFFGLIDEADSIMIDEARTPLVVSSLPTSPEQELERLYHWASEVAITCIENEHYTFDATGHRIELTEQGRRYCRSKLSGTKLHRSTLLDVFEKVETALLVEKRYFRDHQYVVRDNSEVVIVDENTGRLAEGRKWRGGIHQAIEAKEGLSISAETGQAARITIQSLMLKYKRLCGMTGTAIQSAGELRKIYHLNVVEVPTNRPPQRIRLEDRVCASREEKWARIAEEAAETVRSGRPVLIGTRTIEHSEELAQHLTELGIQHQVLNARSPATEAEIVADAGQRGKVTVATNMAGRGTDIMLDKSVLELGGLHVICSELHESQRIDRQLIGRCGRQGDPGTYRTYHSLDDEILRRGFGFAKAEKLRTAIEKRFRIQTAEGAENRARDSSQPKEALQRLAKLFRRAQARIERQHFLDRKHLLQHEKQRKELHEQLGQDPYLDSPI